MVAVVVVVVCDSFRAVLFSDYGKLGKAKRKLGDGGDTAHIAFSLFLELCRRSWFAWWCVTGVCACACSRGRRMDMGVI